MADVSNIAAQPAQATIAKNDEESQVTLYWLEQSRSQRILWLLLALKVPYNIEIFHRDPKTRLAPPSLKAIHPLGKSPVISVKNPAGGDNIVVAESGLITEYLAEHFDGEAKGLVPKRWTPGMEGKVGGETESWRRYKYFLHYSEGSLMGYLIVALIVGRIKTSPVPFFIRPITAMISRNITTTFLTPNFETHFAFLEQQLQTSPGATDGTNAAGAATTPYLCGPHLTAADILMSFPLIAARSRSGFLTTERFPLLVAYVDRLEADEGYKAACREIERLDGKFEAMI